MRFVNTLTSIREALRERTVVASQSELVSQSALARRLGVALVCASLLAGCGSDGTPVSPMADASAVAGDSGVQQHVDAARDGAADARQPHSADAGKHAERDAGTLNGDRANGGAADAGPDSATVQRPSLLSDSLERLGVDTTPTPRVDSDGEPLRNGYAPLGQARVIENYITQLAIVGAGLQGSEDRPLTVLDAEVSTDESGVTHLEGAASIHQPPAGTHAWASPVEDADDSARSRRDAVGYDVDGDGRQELVVVFMDATKRNQLRLQILDDGKANFEILVDDPLLERDDIADVTLAVADFSEDGKPELLIALSRDAAASAGGPRQTELLHFVQAAEGYQASDWTQTFTPHFDDSLVSVILRTGSLDRDHADELVVIVNEESASASGSGATSRYWVYDDALEDFTLLDASPIAGIDRDGTARNAVVGDAAIGDVNGDGRNELTLGGLRALTKNCLDAPFEQLFFQTLSLREGSFEVLDAHSVNASPAIGQDCAASGFEREVRFAPVQHADMDGDGQSELHVGRFIFAWQAPTEGAERRWEEVDSLAGESFYPEPNAVFQRSTSAFTSGDFTGDGRDNLMFYVSNARELVIWGWHPIAAGGERSAYQVSVPIAFNDEDANARPYPLLVAGDFLGNGTVLRYQAESHRLVFTEPVILAALAAAPCGRDIEQNTDACVTRYGMGESLEQGRENTVSFEAGVHLGMNAEIDIPFAPTISTEIIASVNRTESYTLSEAYRLERSVTYETGPLEDAIIFTTIPYDQYTYTIASHPDEDVVGEEVIVSLPREPRRVMAERAFFNAVVVNEGLQIGENVFQHTPGDYRSYPSLATRNELLDGQQNKLIGDREWVSQGTGSTSVELALTEISGHAESLGHSYEMDVTTTLGAVIAGFSVGYGAEATLTVTTEETAVYGGSVGAISGETWRDHQYAFGMFMYTANTAIQSFQVLNYWVESD